MFDFQHPTHFLALFLLPAIAALVVFYLKKRGERLGKFALPAAVTRLVPDFSEKRTWAKTAILSAGLLLLVIAWANPRSGQKMGPSKTRSLDIFIALDISQSMLAQDVTPNRLERARIFCEKAMQELRGNRIGLIVFAGNAYLSMPLTNDFAAATMFLRAANTGMAPTQGTAIAEAIRLASQSFERDGKGGQALLLLTDGENHDDEAIRDAEKAASQGIKIFPIGIGTPAGAQIPVDNGGGLPDVKRDENGQIVTSRLNQTLLAELAKAGNGQAFDIRQGNSEILDALKTQLDRLEKTERAAEAAGELDSFFQWFLAIALIVLAVDFLIKWAK